MPLNRRHIYLLATAAWLLYFLLFPYWTGRSYEQVDFLGFKVWHQSGEFGLQGGRGFSKQSPIWNPPAATSDQIHSSVLLPGQWPYRRYHVELDLVAIFSRWTIGLILCGFIYRFYSRFYPTSAPDPVQLIAWSMSLLLIIGWLIILTISAFSNGFAMTEKVFIGIFVTCVLAGLRLGLGKPLFQLTKADFAAAVRDHSQPSKVKSSVDTGEKITHTLRSLTNFTLGVIAGFCLTLAATWMASFFRGPIIGVSELGTTLYANNQSFINNATGAAVLAIGWLIGILLVWQPRYRPMAVGLMITTTLLGAMIVALFDA